MLWLIVALVWQGFATQTHAHPGGERYRAMIGPVAAVAAAGATDDIRHVPAAPPCALCADKALFGAFLLGGPAVLVAPARAIEPYPTAGLAPFSLARSAPGWRSRAPPTLTA